jgi:hypothetical protein|tara:strand:+ start:80 stop:274 length:195 start_codon:yes stop_codon:yes gene_type:complete
MDINMKKHLKEVKMTYTTHFIIALGMAAETFAMSFVLVLHAIVPCLFQKRFSNWVKGYYKHFRG